MQLLAQDRYGSLWFRIADSVMVAALVPEISKSFKIMMGKSICYGVRGREYPNSRNSDVE